jgi:nucleotide-sensitive chloride channel 1A
MVASALAFTASSSGKGFSVLYPSITIHAVSRSGTRPMVYCQIEQGQDDGAGDDENAELLELKIFPQDSSRSQSIGLYFDMLELNPLFSHPPLS